MNWLSEYMNNILSLYKRFERIYLPIIRLVIAIIWLFYLNVRLGQSPYLDKSYVLIGVAFAIMWLPKTWFVSALQLALLLQLFGISVVAGGIGAIFLFIYYIFYFRLAPEESWMLIGIPMAMVLHLSIVPALVIGLRGKLRSIVGILLSFVFYFYTIFIVERIGRFTEDYANQGISILKGFSSSREWLAYSLIFTLTIMVVYVVKNLRIDYSFAIAAIIGVVVFIITYLIVLKYFALEYQLDILVWNIGVSCLILFLYRNIYHRLDYKRTENLQFEDDDYYYYVKAVPKVKVNLRKKQVDNI